MTYFSGEHFWLLHWTRCGLSIRRCGGFVAIIWRIKHLSNVGRPLNPIGHRLAITWMACVTLPHRSHYLLCVAKAPEGVQTISWQSLWAVQRLITNSWEVRGGEGKHKWPDDGVEARYPAWRHAEHVTIGAPRDVTRRLTRPPNRRSASRPIMAERVLDILFVWAEYKYMYGASAVKLWIHKQLIGGTLRTCSVCCHWLHARVHHTGWRLDWH